MRVTLRLFLLCSTSNLAWVKNLTKKVQELALYLRRVYQVECALCAYHGASNIQSHSTPHHIEFVVLVSDSSAHESVLGVRPLPCLGKHLPILRIM